MSEKGFEYFFYPICIPNSLLLSAQKNKNTEE